MKVYSREEAIQKIESQAAYLVDLDYEQGATDYLELGRLGRKWRVAVMFRAQEIVKIQSEEALLRELRKEKNTFRQRHLFCMFDLENASPTNLREAHFKAAFYGDYILPAKALLHNFSNWE